MNEQVSARPPATTVVVSGASGFLGRHLVKRLRRGGAYVRTLDRAAVKAARDRNELTRLFDGAAAFIHLAWTGTVSDSQTGNPAGADPNVELSTVLFQAALTAGVARTIFASSGGSVYGEPDVLPIAEDCPLRPINSYGAAKAAVEALGERILGAKFVTARMSNIYGPGQRGDRGQGLIATALWRNIRGETLEVWGDGSQLRDYLYVGDAAEALVRLLDYAGRARVFNIGSGTGLSVHEMMYKIADCTGQPGSIAHRPRRGVDAAGNVLDVARAAEHLGWRARTPVALGLKKTLRWSRCVLRGAGT